MKTICKVISILFINIFTSSLFSQTIQIKVESVSEKRSTIDRDNLLEIKVNIKGVELNENKYIRPRRDAAYHRSVHQK